ncbi:MAG: hypothetical protein NVSMB2_09340 [Chloroflexota bacterium]
MRRRRSQRGQAIVEFGLIALVFVGILFAIVDFGLLLNTWLSVSSASREIARNASVGKPQIFLQAEAAGLNLPAVSATGFSTMCCGSASAVEVQVDYLPSTCFGGSSCTPYGLSAVDLLHPFGNVDTRGACGPPPPGSPACRPQADDLVRVTVIAHGAGVITPLMRPWFGCKDGSKPNCNVSLSSTTIMRYEGQEF